MNEDTLFCQTPAPICQLLRVGGAKPVLSDLWTVESKSAKNAVFNGSICRNMKVWYVTNQEKFQD
jgi:hypothetical protein